MKPAEKTNNSYQRNAINGIPWMAFNKISLAFFAFLIKVLLTKTLGLEKYGIYAISASIFGFSLILCALGMHNSILRFLPELMTRGGSKAINVLIFKILSIQSLAGILLVTTLHFLTPNLDNLLENNLGYIIPLSALWALFYILKSTLVESLAALLKVKYIAITSFLQNVGFIIIVSIFLTSESKVGLVLFFHIIVLILSIIILFIIFLKSSRLLSSINSTYVIGKKRLLNLAMPDLLNQSLNSMMMHYSEVFFLGMYFPARIAGIYELGVFLPTMALSIFSHALRTIYISIFAENYIKDKNSIQNLMNTMYKILFLINFPLSALGFYYSSQLIILLFGLQMEAAGLVSSFYSIFLMITTISLPCSVAVITKEKINLTLPVTIAMVIINILLDYLLIPIYGIKGAIIAVCSSQVIIFPITLYVVYKIVGGLFIPINFLLKIFLLNFTIGFIYFKLAPSITFLSMFPIFGSYFALYITLLKVFKIVRINDLGPIASMDNKYISPIINWVTIKE
jgi:O-antigen/teichoic acid export membrane protein